MLGRVDHSIAGAQHAWRELGREPRLARLLAYAIAGHHSGLLDAGSDGTKDIPGTLTHRLAKALEPIPEAPRSILKQPPPRPPTLRWLASSADAGFQLAFFGRMLFSCLVDADFLATEHFMEPHRGHERGTPSADWAAWVGRVDDHVKEKQAGSTPGVVQRCRAAIYRACVAASQLPPGFFSLTVPTGGGKTLASLAFALRHAQRHGLRRVIYTMPFTSIIEQNAAVIRQSLGDPQDVVLEHHSSLDPDKDTTWTRLASENWNAPIVVSTNVQFLESLFACRTSACRKLHRQARSVIVMDEAQSLPVDLLQPCLAALAELVRNYGVSIVLCTATQPAITRREGFRIGLDPVREIIPDSIALFRDLRRTRV